MKPRSDAEAVLSSVRRIVSETPGLGAEAGMRATAGGQPERLLLTPALRVDVGSDSSQLPPRRARVQTRTLTAERVSLEQRIAELEQAVGDQGDWEPDGSEPGDDETPRSFVWNDRMPQDLPLAEARGSDLIDETAMSGAGEEATSGHPKAEAQATRAPEPEEPATEVLRPEEARVAPRGAPRVVPTAGAAADQGADSRPLQLPVQAPGVDLDERVIDEEMLRDIVSEIVRSELQGELGERITRNVRKLVRREIHRAIMTRDFGG